MVVVMSVQLFGGFEKEIVGKWKWQSEATLFEGIVTVMGVETQYHSDNRASYRANIEFYLVEENKRTLLAHYEVKGEQKWEIKGDELITSNPRPQIETKQDTTQAQKKYPHLEPILFMIDQSVKDTTTQESKSTIISIDSKKMLFRSEGEEIVATRVKLFKK